MDADKGKDMDEDVILIDEDEDFDSEGDESDEEDPEGGDEETEEEDLGDDEDEPEDGDGDEPDEDKKTAKIIALKKKAKEDRKIIEEAQRRLAEYEKKTTDSDIEAQVNAQKKKWVDDGYDEKDVNEFANLLRENLKLKRDQEDSVWKKLSAKYPSAENHKAAILELKSKMPEATLEDIYLAKFHSLSAKEQKRQAEQEALYRQKKGQEKGKGNVAGGGGKEKPVKLSASDEKVYAIAKQLHPNLTRAQFQKDADEEEEIDDMRK